MPREGFKQSDEHRKKIDTSKLLCRLQNNALGKLQKPMTSEQIASARICLAKSVPDLKAVETTGEVDHKLEITWKS